MSVPQTTRQIWAAPIVLGIVSTIGLVSALLGDGIWDLLSWLLPSSSLVGIWRSPLLGSGDPAALWLFYE